MLFWDQNPKLQKIATLLPWPGGHPPSPALQVVVFFKIYLIFRCKFYILHYTGCVYLVSPLDITIITNIN